MRHTLYITANTLPLISVEQWMHATHQYVICPFYHVVSDHMLPHITPLYRHRLVEEFMRDLDWLQAHFTPISWDEIDQAEQKQQPSFCLSFDDGLSEFYHVVAPILKTRSIPCIQFLNSAFVNNKALMYRYKVSLIISQLSQQGRLRHATQRQLLSMSYSQTYQIDAIAASIGLDWQAWLQREQPYLTINQIRDLQQQGFQFGGHSVDHPNYGELTPVEQWKQTEQCFRDLQHMGIQTMAFSYPFGRIGVNKDFDSQVRTLYSAIFTTDNITPNQKPVYHRFAAECNRYPLSWIVKGEYLRSWIKYGQKTI